MRWVPSPSRFSDSGNCATPSAPRWRPTKTYEQTVLTAFADVEKALVAIATYRSQTERTGELVLSNDRIATMTRALYRSGLSDYLDVIDAERSLYQSQMSHVNLVVQQYINYVTLCKALGGGWTAAMQN